MVVMDQIHRLDEVDLRLVWPNEAQDFTPWLASNPEHLGELIGIDLELEGEEMPVGRYSADIVFRDASTGDRIVVENWLEPTDHDHLGKLITYASGLQATYGVLVAREFRPEHRSALAWLNSISKTGTGFFGIEVHAVQIADSPTAVKLDVVVEPDDWSREVSVAVELSEGMARYRDWWSEFLPAFHARYPGWSNATKPQAQGWMNFPARKSYIQYTLTWTSGSSPLGYALRVELYMDDGARFYPHLSKHRQEIDDAINGDLQWEELPDSKASRLALYLDPAEPSDRDHWPQYREWGLKTLGHMREVLQQYVDSTP